MQNFKNREDYVTWLEITKTLKIVKGIEQPLLDYRIYKNQTSSNKLKMAKYQWKVYRNHENLGLLKSIYYFLHYTVNGLLKYKIKR
ncbi:hypothetical protein [Campylobacter mucosalis]|nr:hypothetical protein [Campylobacter mucosalis]